MLRKTLLVLCATSFIAVAAQASAQEAPDKMVQRVTEEVMTIVQSDKNIQGGDRNRIRQVINDKILPNLDFERTTSLAMGRYWRDATPEQKQQVEKEFRALLIYTYSGAMTLIRDQKITYEPFRADPAATDVEVFAHANTSQGQQVRFGYRLIKNPDGWKVYDVNVLGAWLIQTYKDSFAYEIRRSGIDGLIKTLSDKNKRLASGPVKTNPESLKEQLPAGGT
jgi:phospholipid transport system substrate-binding protein